MTIALPIAWTGLVLGVVGFVYALIRDVMDGKRIDKLETLTAGLRGDITEMLRDRRRDFAAIHTRIDSLVPEPRRIEEPEAPQSAFPLVNLEEPTTQPILRVPTDTVAQAAAIDAGLAAITTEVAHYGRHAHRMPRGVK